MQASKQAGKTKQATRAPKKAMAAAAMLKNELTKNCEKKGEALSDARNQ